MNHKELLGLIRKEGEISEEELLDKARLAGIFKPKSALRYLQGKGNVKMTQVDGKSTVSYNGQ